jgi:RAB6A-GEF complex partner protein 2
MSEQPSVMSDRPQLSNARILQHYRMPSQQAPRKPQAANLLMGYAHLNATFTVDGSLVDQSQFEEVKKKGFLGGQAGGGVVGIKKARPTSGFLGGFSFNSIGESLNSLVGGDNMSSVKEMNAVTTSRVVPLLSTPQSLLFVDLHLEPREEKSFAFTTRLPRGLPSSYRGKAIKISYNIQIGVQGVPGHRDTHKVRQISVPVRVFSGVDSEGGILGHDLMQPHVILQDLARVKALDPTDEHSKPVLSTSRKQGDQDTFLTYIDTLLDRSRRRQSSSSYILDTSLSTDPSLNPTLQSIHRAIQLSNQTHLPSTADTGNTFTIARSQHPIATITLNRTLHLLGDPITAVIDFSPSPNAIPCAALHMTLESMETVSPSLAIRSEASIARVTRRVYVARSENTLFARRAVFKCDVPVGAAPSFVTSGVGLEWGVRFEFVVVKGERAATLDDEDDEQGEEGGARDGERRGGDESGDEEDADANSPSSEQVNPTTQKKSIQPHTQITYPSLLEELSNDDRGIVSVALERFDTETFDVRIPITVYGDVVQEGGEEEGFERGVGIPI